MRTVTEINAELSELLKNRRLELQTNYFIMGEELQMDPHALAAIEREPVGASMIELYKIMKYLSLVPQFDCLCFTIMQRIITASDLLSLDPNPSNVEGDVVSIFR